MSERRSRGRRRLGWWHGELDSGRRHLTDVGNGHRSGRLPLILGSLLGPSRRLGGAGQGAQGVAGGAGADSRHGGHALSAAGTRPVGAKTIYFRAHLHIWV